MELIWSQVVHDIHVIQLSLIPGYKRTPTILTLLKFNPSVYKMNREDTSDVRTLFAKLPHVYLGKEDSHQDIGSLLQEILERTSATQCHDLTSKPFVPIRCPDRHI